VLAILGMLASLAGGQRAPSPPEKGGAGTAGTGLPAADAALLEQLRAGDEGAFRELVDRFHGPLLRLAQSFAPSRAVAEEVVQETWLGVLQGLPSFEGRSSLKTWIFRILSNRAKTRASREARSLPFSAWDGPDDESFSAVDPQRFTAKGSWAAPPGRWHEAAAEARLHGKDTMALLEKAIDELPLNQQAVVTLRDIEELRAAAVCNILELSETNQRVLLHRARSKVRRALEKHYGNE